MNLTALYPFVATALMALTVASVGGIILQHVFWAISRFRVLGDDRRASGWARLFGALPWLWLPAGVIVVVSGLFCLFSARESFIGLQALFLAAISGLISYWGYNAAKLMHMKYRG